VDVRRQSQESRFQEKITHHIDVVVLNIVVMADPMQYVDSRIDICVDTDSVQSHANCSTRMFLT